LQEPSGSILTRQAPIIATGGEPVEASASIEIAKHTLMTGGLILAVGVVTGLLAQRIRVPDVRCFSSSAS